ncbi:MAG: type II toxin-antitoxin system RelE/ParE family toxin [Chloroflexi bacterium]|nr:type II toxin-antitoxin system RelE/ParE family toxin [Chloroflexota bacterium]
MAPVKPLEWIGSSLDDLRGFPTVVRTKVGYALWVAQRGGKHPDAKPLRGFGGAGVLEIVEDFAGDTYRAVYTVKFSDVVYVLHAFETKSRRGRETARSDIELVRARLQRAQQIYAAEQEGKQR